MNGNASVSLYIYSQR